MFSNYKEVIGRTFSFALIATVLAVAIGYPLAYFIAMKGGKYKNVLLALVVLAVLHHVPDPHVGVEDSAVLRWPGRRASCDGLACLSKNGEILNTNFAVIGALLYNFLPFMVLPIYVSLEKIDKRLLEAAPDLYANGRQTFTRVTLPLSLPGVFAGSLLTFIPACGDFVNADLLGGDRQRMIGNVIERNFQLEVFRPQMSALSFVLMLLILLGVLAYARLLGTEELV